MPPNLVEGVSPGSDNSVSVTDLEEQEEHDNENEIKEAPEIYELAQIHVHDIVVEITALMFMAHSHESC